MASVDTNCLVLLLDDTRRSFGTGVARRPARGILVAAAAYIVRGCQAIAQKS